MGKCDRSQTKAGGPSGPRIIRKSMGQKRYGVMFRGIEGDTLEVMGMDPGSVAEQAGLEIGDVIVKMNGKEVATLATDERVNFLRGSPLTVTVDRDGQTMEIAMSLD